MILLAILASFLILWAASGRADTVYMKDGTEKEGTIVEETDQEVVLEMTIRGIKASLHIQKEEIDRIERSKSKKEALADEANKLEASDADGWYKLGLKYKAMGEADEAKRCFEKALRANPDHEGAARETGGVRVDGRFADVNVTLKKGAELAEAKEYGKVIEALEPLLDTASSGINSLQRKDALGVLIKCYECKGDWPKAQEAYENLLKCPSVDKSEVALIRVKQRILKENPDGMVDLGAMERKKKDAGFKLEDIPGQIVKLPVDLALAPMKAGSELMKSKEDKEKEKKKEKEGKSAQGKKPKGKDAPQYAAGEKQPLSDPKVMELVIRANAEDILLEAQRKVEKADAQAQSDKLWEVTPFPAIARMAGGNRPRTTLRQSEADKLYEAAADVADDADYLIPGISAPLRLKIALKRAALLDEYIDKARKEVEANSYYFPPPPPNAPPAQAQVLLQQQNQRLQTLNVTQDAADKYVDLVQRLDALQARKLELLEPFSDQILQQVEKVQKDREAITDIRQKAEKISDLADVVRENEKMEAQLAEYNVKAQANRPSSFETQMGYEKFIAADGVYHFKDGGRAWRARTDYCVSYCEKALELGRKRIALLRKYPDRPVFARDVDQTKSMMVTIYQLEQGVLMTRNRKGRAATSY